MIAMATNPPDAVFLIHGTFSHRDEDHFAAHTDHPDGRATWWQKNSDFVAEMDRLFGGRASCWPEDVCRAMPWAGRSFWHRFEAWTIRGRRPFRWIRPRR